MAIFEIVGMLFSILGAWSISKADQKSLNRAFWFFLISNLALLIFFMENEKGPMFIQFSLFFSTAVIGIIKTGDRKNLKRNLIVISIISSIAIAIILRAKITSMDFELIDLVASGMAIVGSFLLSSKIYIRRQAAYILFIAADILFVYIGLANLFVFFTLQSGYFVYTSIQGLKNNRRLEKSL